MMVNRSRLIYVSHFLSAWGDRMWRFAVALFLMDLASDSLLLPAIYGLTLAGSVLTLGPVIGTVIDRSRRLPTAQASVVIQDLAIAACAAILLIHKLSLVSGDWFTLFVKISCVVLGTVAHMGSTASKIMLEKDWIVVIAEGDNTMLSDLNSTLRRIDLFTKLLAPMAVGQLITLVSMTFGCAFVAGWNVISMFVEYIMLKIVYDNTPALAVKRSQVVEQPRMTSTDDESVGEEAPLLGAEPHRNIKKYTEDDMNASSSQEVVEVRTEQPTSCWKSAFSFILIIPKGWSLFMSQSVSLAGIGLSCLYMTVLGFDSITVSYAYNQCFSEFFVGLLMAASAVTGIISTFAFGPLSRRIGLIKTGQLSSIAQLLTLVPCAYSVFALGSPFFLLPSNRNSTAYVVRNTSTPLYTSEVTATTSPDYDDGLFLKCLHGVSPPSSYLSLSLLMGGAILARIGLWSFDLSVTQLFQEEVQESERGVVGGVQSSMNNLMDLIHFILVIVLPAPSQFGLLILTSVVFVCLGHFFYAIFAKKVSGSCCLCC